MDTLSLQESKITLQEKIKHWLKNPYNLVLISLILGIILIRFYYFVKTMNQPLWWDESEYMAMAKNFAGIVSYEANEQRLPGFPMVVSLFYMIGISGEPILKFILAFLPSIGAIILLYFCIKEMYPDKRIALISLAILGVLWEHLFYSNRMHTENFALIFEFLAIIVLYKCYMKKENLWIFNSKYSLLWITLFSFLSVFFRPGNLMFVPAVIFLILILNQSYIPDNQRKIISIVGLVILVGLAILTIIFLPSIPLLRTYYHPENPIAWQPLTSFNGFYGSVISWMPSIFLYLFLIGSLITLFRVGILYDKIKEIKRDKELLEYKSDLFNIFLIVSILAIFIFLMRTSTFEFRWFFMFLPAMLAFTSIGIISTSEFIGSFLKNKKLIGIILILIFLSMGLYNQWFHADSIINMKLTSYGQVKEAGLWLKDNSAKGDIILSQSYPQTTYYSERKVISFTSKSSNLTEFEKIFLSIKPRYVIMSIFEYHPDWIKQDFLNKYGNNLKPVNVWFMDAEKTQPALIIYEMNYTSLNISSSNK